jgi:hypothetical protein
MASNRCEQALSLSSNRLRWVWCSADDIQETLRLVLKPSGAKVPCLPSS